MSVSTRLVHFLSNRIQNGNEFGNDEVQDHNSEEEEEQIFDVSI